MMKTLRKCFAAMLLFSAAMMPAQAYDEIGSVRGRTIGEWSGKWWQWAFSFPEGFPNGEPFKAGKVDCSAGQEGGVWFLAGTGLASNEPLPGPGQALERICKKPIPRGVLLFFPLLNASLYNPDVLCGTSGKPENCTVSEKRRILDEIFSDTVPGPYVSQACRLKAALDGKPVQFSDYPIVRTQSPVFPLEGDRKAVSDGFWVMLPSLERGKHTIEISGNFCAFNDYTAPVLFGIDVRYTLTIQ